MKGEGLESNPLSRELLHLPSFNRCLGWFWHKIYGNSTMFNHRMGNSLMLL